MAAKAEKPKEKSKVDKKRLRKRVISALLALGLLYAGFTFVRQEIKMREQNGEIAEAKKTLEQWQDGNLQLSRQIDYMNTQDYIEDAAREKLGWIKQGEILFLAPEGDTPQPEGDTQQNQQQGESKDGEEAAWSGSFKPVSPPED